MPGTFGYIDLHFVLWENNVTIIASLKVINQPYDFINITTRDLNVEVFFTGSIILSVLRLEKKGTLSCQNSIITKAAEVGYQKLSSPICLV